MTNHRITFLCLLCACSSESDPAQSSSAGDELEAPASPEAEGARGEPSEPPLDAAARSRVVREMARAVGAMYVFTDAGAELERMLLARLAEGAYDSIVDARELARVLTSELRSVRSDKHLGVTLRASGDASEPPRAAQAGSGIRKVAVLANNVGYIELEGLPPLERSRAAISAAFTLLRDTDALIIDNRDNHGGDPGTVAHYVSYLSEGSPFVVSRVRFRDDRRIDELRSTDLGERSYGAGRPVFVLDSAATFSGGEDLSYSLQAHGRAKVVGEVTAGGAHPTLGVPLGHGFVGSVPFARSENPITGSNWEGVGVIPDVGVPAERALAEAEKLARAAIEERRLERAVEKTALDDSGIQRARAQTPLPARSPNQVLNGDFSRGLAPWGITTWGAGPLAEGPHPHRLDGDRLCFDIEPGQRVLVGWPPESSSHAIALERSLRYQLSFKASATGTLPLDAEVSVGHRLPPYTAITTAQLALDASFQPFSVEVTPEEHDDQVGLAFKLAALGAAGEREVCIDDVELTLPEVER